MRRLSLLIALLLLAVAWTGGGAGGGASPAVPVYLALGDSLAAGAGASQPSQTAYVPLVFNALRTEAASPYRESGLALVNLGVSGETTTSMLAGGGQLDKALAEIESRRDDGIAGNEVVVITIDIGANDFIPLVETPSPCLPNPLAGACQDAARLALDTFRSNFADIMRRLRSAAGPEVPMVAVGLYNPLSGAGGPFGGLGDTVVQVFNGTMASVAREADIQAKVAEIFPLFQGKGPQLTHIEDLPPDIHPNDSGYYQMAQAVLAALGLAPGGVASPTAGPLASPSAVPPVGGGGDDDRPWVPYIGLIVVGVGVVGAGVLVLARRRAGRSR